MEFHAIILCGPGKQLSPFSKTRATGIAKALLPLAEKPMIEHVLDWCEKAFFPKVTILCDEESGDEIGKAIQNYKSQKNAFAASTATNTTTALDPESDTAFFTHSIEVVQYDGSSSGQVLQFLKEGNTLHSFEHFVLLPCDFITNLPPQVLIEAYRCRDDTDIGMLVNYYNQLDIEDKKNKIFPKNYTVYTDNLFGKSQLLDYYSSEDVAFHKSFQIRTQLLWNHPKTSVSTRVLNGSIFFGESKEIFRRFEQLPEKFSDSYFASRPLIKVVRDLARKEWQSPEWNSTIGFLIVPKQASFIRANTLPVYMEANRFILKAKAKENAGGKSSAPKDKTAATVGADSMIGENTQLGERTNVKRSVVGSNCTIGKRVKLTGSIILDNVTVEDDVQLENTIVGYGATIRSKSKLVNCNVESTHDVAKATQSKGDTLLCLTLEGLVESAVESSSSDEDDSDISSDEYDEEYGDNSDGLFGY